MVCLNLFYYTFFYVNIYIYTYLNIFSLFQAHGSFPKPSRLKLCLFQNPAGSFPKPSRVAAMWVFSKTHGGTSCEVLLFQEPIPHFHCLLLSQGIIFQSFPELAHYPLVILRLVGCDLHNHVLLPSFHIALNV